MSVIKVLFCFIALMFALPSIMASAQYRVYWGDLHCHTTISDGTTDLDQCLTYARDKAGLDFLITTDHDFGNCAPWRMPESDWNLIQDKADTYTVDGRFVAVAGYEWTSAPKYWKSWISDGKETSERLFDGPPKYYNHKNVYFPKRVKYLFSAKEAESNTPDLLAEVVLKNGGLIQNNHPCEPKSLEGRDQFEYGPSCYSVITNTEMGQDMTHYGGKTYDLQWEQVVRKFLNGGGRTGFVKGTDSHEGKPAARTAVLAKELTREAIFEALRHRRNYAVSNAKIAFDFRINGHFMGEEIAIEGIPEIMVSVKGTDGLKEVAIIKDGFPLYSIGPAGQTVDLVYRDEAFKGSAYYYLRVIQADVDEYDNNSYAWSSPIWVMRKQYKR